MKITTTNGTTTIDARDTLLIGFNDYALCVEGDVTANVMLAGIIHASAFGRGWRGRLRLAWYVFRYARTVRYTPPTPDPLDDALSTERLGVNL